jgi:predicted nucleotide-binding protein
MTQQNGRIPIPLTPLFLPKPPTKVFLVHGRNLSIRDSIDLFLSKELRLTTVVMEAGAHEGRTLPEKFESLAAQCSFAIFIITLDDSLTDNTTGKKIKRARQNVILEVGYFWGRLGRQRKVAFLVQEDMEKDLPSDIDGIGWIPITKDLALTKQKLTQELRAVGILRN